MNKQEKTKLKESINNTISYVAWKCGICKNSGKECTGCILNMCAENALVAKLGRVWILADQEKTED